MATTEWNLVDALIEEFTLIETFEVAKKESREEGIAIGEENKEKEKEEARKEEREKIIALLRRGYSLDEVEKMLSKV